MGRTIVPDYKPRSPSDLAALMLRNGWILARHQGPHQVWKHPDTTEQITLPTSTDKRSTISPGVSKSIIQAVRRIGPAKDMSESTTVPPSLRSTEDAIKAVGGKLLPAATATPNRVVLPPSNIQEPKKPGRLTVGLFKAWPTGRPKTTNTGTSWAWNIFLTRASKSGVTFSWYTVGTVSEVTEYMKALENRYCPKERPAPVGLYQPIYKAGSYWFWTGPEKTVHPRAWIHEATPPDQIQGLISAAPQPPCHPDPLELKAVKLRPLIRAKSKKPDEQKTVEVVKQAPESQKTEAVEPTKPKTLGSPLKDSPFGQNSYYFGRVSARYVRDGKAYVWRLYTMSSPTQPGGKSIGRFNPSTFEELKELAMAKNKEYGFDYPFEVEGGTLRAVMDPTFQTHTWHIYDGDTLLHTGVEKSVRTIQAYLYQRSLSLHREEETQESEKPQEKLLENQPALEGRAVEVTVGSPPVQGTVPYHGPINIEVKPRCLVMQLPEDEYKQLSALLEQFKAPAYRLVSTTLPTLDDVGLMVLRRGLKSLEG